MSCEHHGHCHHVEADQQVQQHVVQRLGNLCCAGQCQHVEHQTMFNQMETETAKHMEQIQRELAEANVKTEKRNQKKKKRSVRTGFMQSLVMAEAR